MPKEPASNGCSQPTKHAPKWAAPIPSQRPPPVTPNSKSHNHCAEVLVGSTHPTVQASRGTFCFACRLLLASCRHVVHIGEDTIRFDRSQLGQGRICFVLDVFTIFKCSSAIAI